MTDDWGSIVDQQSLLVVNTGGVSFYLFPRPKTMPVLEGSPTAGLFIIQHMPM